MRVYSVHIRRHGLDYDRDIAVVKEGFSWPALCFGALWALYMHVQKSVGIDDALEYGGRAGMTSPALTDLVRDSMAGNSATP